MTVPPHREACRGCGQEDWAAGLLLGAPQRLKPLIAKLVCCGGSSQIIVSWPCSIRTPALGRLYLPHEAHAGGGDETGTAPIWPPPFSRPIKASLRRRTRRLDWQKQMPLDGETKTKPAVEIQGELMELCGLGIWPRGVAGLQWETTGHVAKTRPLSSHEAVRQSTRW